MRDRPVVAIDGPSGVGKSTVARRVARTLGFVYLDTGALYRTVALIGDRAGIGWEKGADLARALRAHELSIDSESGVQLDGIPLGDAIRTARMSAGASAVARHFEVRDALLARQRALGENGGVVLEGRDIGTVVFPDAECKFFLTASDDVRARRRFEEMRSRGDDVSLDEVLSDQRRRDHADTTRLISPLRKADDAVEVSTDEMSADEVSQMIVNEIRVSFPLTSK